MTFRTGTHLAEKKNEFMSEPPTYFLWHQSILLSWFSWPLFKGRFQKSMTLWQCNFPFATSNLWPNSVAFIYCSCFPCYFAPLFGETGLGIEVAVGNDKSLEAKIENMAKLLTQYCILRLADLSVISAKDNLTCKANTLTCCHHNCSTQF